MGVLVAAFVGLASALLAIFLTPVLQHYFWRRQRHAELCLPVIERCANLILSVQECLLGIQNQRKTTEADITLLRQWEALGIEIQALFSSQTNRRLDGLSELIVKYSAPLESGGFRPSDFYNARTEAFSALYSELELTGDQLASHRCWQFWRR